MLKETEEQRRKADTCDRRIKEMETQVGMIEHTACYKDGFDLGDEKVTLQGFASQFREPDLERSNLTSGNTNRQEIKLDE